MTLKYLNKLSKSKHFLNYHWIPTNDYLGRKINLLSCSTSSLKIYIQNRMGISWA